MSGRVGKISNYAVIQEKYLLPTILKISIVGWAKYLNYAVIQEKYLLPTIFLRCYRKTFIAHLDVINNQYA